MTILIHDGQVLGPISRWGETLNNPEEIGNKFIDQAEHVFSIDGLNESGQPIQIDILHALSNRYHQYMALRLPEQKFFFKGRRISFYSCVVAGKGPGNVLTHSVHQCQVWKDLLFQRNCRGFATKFMMKLLDKAHVLIGDYSQTPDGMNLWLNFLSYAMASQKYTLFYILADHKFDRNGGELPLKRYLVKLETSADILAHYCQDIMGDDPVFAFRAAGGTLRDIPLESLLSDPDKTEILTCKEAEQKGVFKAPLPFKAWPKKDRRTFNETRWMIDETFTD